MLDLGFELKQLRLQKNLSLEQISEATKINIKYLEKIENNDFEFMPRIYVRSFIKSYLRTLNVNEKEFLEVFDELTSQPATPKLEEQKVKTSPQTSETKTEIEEQPVKPQLLIQFNFASKKFLYLTVGVILLILISVLVFSSLSKDTIGSDSIKQTNLVDVSISKISDEFSNIANKDSLTLGIRAKDSVWIQINIDNNKIEEVYMRKGDFKKFRGKNDFKLFVGNAGGITLYLNETELPFTGVKGSVKRLKVDKEGVKLIQTKYESKNQ